MITHIRMQNFKSWKNSGKVDLAPLTGFFGTNSSGKSSLLQMLLLLKQNVGHSKPREPIFFGNETSLVNLGKFHEVIHGHEQEDQLCLEFGCKFKEPFKIGVYGKTPDGPSGEVLVPIGNFAFNTVIHEVWGNLMIDSFRYGFESCEVPEVKWERGFLSHTDLFGNPHRQQIGTMSCYGGPPEQQHALLRPLSQAFEKLFSHVYYLSPTRVDPRRHYNWQGGHPEHIRQWGDQTIDALLSARVRKLKTVHEEEDIPIEERVSYWLREMELTHSFSLDWTNQGATEYEVRIQKSPTSAAVTLADMGYGLGQFLPVLVLCYYAPEGSTLILEQPGIHLHPKVQSQLADLLIEVVIERNLQILVESHSEHLLNRLQRRVAEEKIAADQTALYFCRNDEGVSNIDRLKMDEFGNITNWPENFFGDEMGDLFAMTKAQRERQRKAEG